MSRLFSNLFFQDVKQVVVTFTFIGAKKFLVTCPLKRGNPRHLPRLLALLIPRMLETSWGLFWLVFLKKIFLIFQVSLSPQDTK